MKVSFLYLIFLLIAVSKANSSTTPCTTDNINGCQCNTLLTRNYELKCERTDLDRIPTPSSMVSKLEMFRSTLTHTSIRASTFQFATNIESIKIESCDITDVDFGSLFGLYSLQTLDLAYNRLKLLPLLIFRDLNFLQNLDLSYNSISQLDAQTFVGLSNLNTLDLSYNNLQYMSNNTLVHLRSLKTLSLRNALLSMTILPENFLYHTPLLETIMLNDNQVITLQEDMFNFTDGLKTIGLSGNKIRTLSAVTFTPLRQLYELDLEGNPFICDCMLLNYKNWIDGWKLLARTTLKTGACMEPDHLKGQYISNIPVANFLCTTSTSSAAITTLSYVITADGKPSSTKQEKNTTFNSSHYATESPATETTVPAEERNMEKSIIIGCAIGVSFLLILVALVIIFCIRYIRKKKNMERIKYIVKPKAQVEDIYYIKEPYSPPLVNDAGNGYIITNSNSGFYHAGSCTRLYEEDSDITQNLSGVIVQKCYEKDDIIRYDDAKIANKSIEEQLDCGDSISQGKSSAGYHYQLNNQEQTTLTKNMGLCLSPVLRASLSHSVGESRDSGLHSESPVFINQSDYPFANYTISQTPQSTEYQSNTLKSINKKIRSETYV